MGLGRLEFGLIPLRRWLKLQPGSTAHHVEYHEPCRAGAGIYVFAISRCLLRDLPVLHHGAYRRQAARRFIEMSLLGSQLLSLVHCCRPSSDFFNLEY